MVAVGVTAVRTTVKVVDSVSSLVLYVVISRGFRCTEYKVDQGSAPCFRGKQDVFEKQTGD